MNSGTRILFSGVSHEKVQGLFPQGKASSHTSKCGPGSRTSSVRELGAKAAPLPTPDLLSPNPHVIKTPGVYKHARV